MQISGPAVVVGDDVDTDVIFPARYLAVLDRKQQGRHVFEPLGPSYRDRLSAGGILVGGENLGCGSSREHAVTCLIGVGARAVIAKSVARIFFRNCINLGLPVVISPALVEAVADGAEVDVDLAQGEGRSGGRSVRFEPLPAALLEILSAGGLWARRAKERATQLSVPRTSRQR